MTIFFTDRGTADSGGSFVTSLAVSNSFTPVQGDLILVGINLDGSRTVSSVTATGNWGVTFVKITGTVITNASSIELWGAFVTEASPSAGIVTANHGSARPTGLCVQAVGADSSGTVANAIIQSTFATGNDVRDDLVLGTFSDFGDTANMGFIFGENDDQSKTFLPDTGWTELQDQAAGYAARVGTSYKEGTTTSPTLSYDTSAFVYTRGIAIELAVAASLIIDTEPTNVRKAEIGIILGASAGGFGVTQGTGGVTLGTKAVTVTSWSDTSVTVTVPIDIALQSDITGYVFQVTTDAAETVDSSVIPLAPQTGWISKDLIDPNFSSDWYTLYGYTGDTPVTGDSEEITEVGSPIQDPPIVILELLADSSIVLSSIPLVTQTFPRRVIQADGTVGATEDYVLEITSDTTKQINGVIITGTPITGTLITGTEI